jgi:hypothetical protein
MDENVHEIDRPDSRPPGIDATIRSLIAQARVPRAGRAGLPVTA